MQDVVNPITQRVCVVGCHGSVYRPQDDVKQDVVLSRQHAEPLASNGRNVVVGRDRYDSDLFDQVRLAPECVANPVTQRLGVGSAGHRDRQVAPSRR